MLEQQHGVPLGPSQPTQVPASHPGGCFPDTSFLPLSPSLSLSCSVHILSSLASPSLLSEYYSSSPVTLNFSPFWKHTEPFLNLLPLHHLCPLSGIPIPCSTLGKSRGDGEEIWIFNEGVQAGSCWLVILRLAPVAKFLKDTGPLQDIMDCGYI